VQRRLVGLDGAHDGLRRTYRITDLLAAVSADESAVVVADARALLMA
jgi:hypothetical protein